MISVYVTGTDTDIGKTWTCIALLHALRAGGATAIGMKPVASGCADTPDGWRNADALALQAASAPQPAYALVNPYALPEPAAPELAASHFGTEVQLAPICAAYAELGALSPTLVVEGVGGWAAPLSARLDQSQLVHALDLPVVLVVGVRIGCISHARLTTRAIAADGCRLLGWVANLIDPDVIHLDATLGILDRVIGAPCMGVLPFDPSRSRPADAASCLNLEVLGGATS
jgi:dethiobiotin synthetase